MADPLSEWLRSRGGFISDKVDLFHQLSNGDRGVCAIKDIDAGEQLMLIPVECTLHVPTLQELKDAEKDGADSQYSEAAKYIATHHPSTSSFIATVLALMSEIARGADSRWLQYIKHLPSACDCVLAWDERDQAALEGTSIEDITRGAATDAAFQQEVMPKVAGRPDLWPPGEATSLAAFMHAAGLVQSRAFHMEMENWVLRTKQEGAELFCIPAIDMVNHASDPARRNASLLKLSHMMKVEVGGREVAFKGFFTMKADEAIPAGAEVLHTYGDLSDAQLLQTYGFIDMGATPAAAPASVAGSKQNSKGGKGAKRAAGSKADGAEGVALPEWANPFNHVLVPFESVRTKCREVLEQVVDGAQPYSEEEEEAKVAFLEKAGVLQRGAAAATDFVLNGKALLPEELLTAVQVLLLLKEEYEELVAEYEGGLLDGSDESEEEEEEEEEEEAGPGAGGKGKKGNKSKGKGAEPGKASGKGDAKHDKSGAGGMVVVAGVGAGVSKGSAAASGPAAQKAAPQAAAAAGNSTAGAGDTGAAQARKPLRLGTGLLAQDPEFAELVSLTLIQIVDACMARYPTSVADDVHTLRTIASLSSKGDSTGAVGSSKAGSKAGGKQVKGSKAGHHEDKLQQLEKELKGLTPTQLNRRKLAVMVRLGEKDVLQLAKKEAVVLVLRLEAAMRAAAQAAGALSDDDEDSDEEMSFDSEEMSEGTEGDEDDEDDDDSMHDDDDAEEEEAPAKAMRGVKRGMATLPAAAAGKGAKRAKQAEAAPPVSKKGTTAASALNRAGAKAGKAGATKVGGKAALSTAASKAKAATKGMTTKGKGKQAAAVDEEQEVEGAEDEAFLNSDDSDKVGYAGDDFDDGIGEAHDRGAPHALPKPSPPVATKKTAAGKAGTGTKASGKARRR